MTLSLNELETHSYQHKILHKYVKYEFEVPLNNQNIFKIHHSNHTKKF